MKVVTIAREFAAGGHTVGRKVAEELGLEFLDRDIIAQAAKASGVSFEEVKKEEEVMTRSESFIRTINPSSFDLKDTVFNYERDTIIAMAKKGPCVILGRCAGVVLEEAGIECIRVFLTSSVENRIQRAGELLNLTERDDILKGMKRMDAGRKAYYEFYTNRHWGLIKDYTMCLDTHELGHDLCVKLICEAARRS